MHSLLALSRGIDRVTELIGRSVIWLILLAILVSATNAVVRKVFSVSSNGWLELQWYLFGTAFMLAAAYTLKHNEHIRIDIFYGSRTRRTQHRIDLIGHVLFLMPFVLLMTWMTVPYALGAWRSGQVSTNAGGLAIWPARAVIAAGFILLSLQGVSEIVKKVAILRGLIPDPNPPPAAEAIAGLQVDAATGAADGEPGR
jgi:TRAP-type mannitol/chloroaromatic compound transport system permease small subunit